MKPNKKKPVLTVTGAVKKLGQFKKENISKAHFSAIFFTVRQVAQLCGMHEDTIYKAAQSGSLPYFKLSGIKISPVDLVNWISERRVESFKAEESAEETRKRLQAWKDAIQKEVTEQM
jgi:excisionase family DNA binding protein